MKKEKEILKELKELKQEVKNLKEIPTINVSWKGFLRLLSFLGSSALAVLNFWFIFYVWNYLNIDIIDGKLIDLIIIPDLILEYVLIILAMICLVALIKGGFDKLKSCDEAGIIFGLIYGLIGGLIIGLIFGLIDEFKR